MSHSHRRKTSTGLYFRMDVPRDVRHLVGKPSWQHSLGTTDHTLSDTRRARYASRYKADEYRLRALLDHETAAREERRCG